VSSRHRNSGIPRLASHHLSELAQFVRTKQATFHFGVHCMTSHRIPVSIQRKTCNILETLTNLLYLAEMEADDPQKVRTYLSLSKERVQAMTLWQPMRRSYAAVSMQPGTSQEVK